MIFVVIGVAFIILLERRVLGYVHILKGPNKVGFVGIPQPFRDAIKFFTKEQLFYLLFFSYFGVFPFLIGWVVGFLFEWFYFFCVGFVVFFFGWYLSCGLYCYNCWVVF
jgi:NADH-ubiquinone oxidoreductase chain 1